MAFFLHPLYLDWYEGAFLGKRRSKPLHRGSPLHVSPGRYMDTGWEHQQRMKIWQPVVADPPPKSQNLPVDETQNTPASKFTASFVVVAFYSLSRVRLFVTWWTVAHEAPPSMASSKALAFCSSKGRGLPETGWEGLELQALGPCSGSFSDTGLWTRMIFKIYNSCQWTLGTRTGP